MLRLSKVKTQQHTCSDEIFEMDGTNDTVNSSVSHYTKKITLREYINSTNLRRYGRSKQDNAEIDDYVLARVNC